MNDLKRILLVEDSEADAYLVKPVDFARFVEAVKEVGMLWALVNHPPPGSVGEGP